MTRPAKILMHFPKRLSDLDWRLLLIVLPSLSFLIYISLSSTIALNTATVGVFNSFSTFSPFKSLFSTTTPHRDNTTIVPDATITTATASLRLNSSWANESEKNMWMWRRKRELDRSRIAICLVGGARRFELTGPSILNNVLRVYKNSDLFLHSPLDSNSYKFSLLKSAPRIASVKIFEPKPIPQTDSELRVLTSLNSPNGIQGLLQYFNLVEGCLTMIKSYQEQNNFTYDWIVRTRVDGYWSDLLGPDYFIPGKYLVPPGSSYGGLNDRFGVGDLNTSTVALSRLSLIPQLDQAGKAQLNSERAFKAQLVTQNVSYVTKRLPFCVVSDRKYGYPPARFGVPVAAISSPGPLSGAKCRPCSPVCSGPCVGPIMNNLDRGWSWTDWANNTVQLCDAGGEWEDGWERLFDKAAGKKLAAARRRVSGLKLEYCIKDFELMKKRTANWESPPAAEICRLGLASQ